MASDRVPAAGVRAAHAAFVAFVVVDTLRRRDRWISDHLLNAWVREVCKADMKTNRDT